MPVGTNYAQGYSLGQRDRQFDQTMNANAYSRIYGNSRPMQGAPFALNSETTSGRSGGVIPSASDIRAIAIQDALNRKADELKVDRMKLENEKASLANEAMQYGLDRTKLTGIQADEDRLQNQITAHRAGVQAEGNQQKQQFIDNAMQSLYSGNAEGIQQFFDMYGSPDISIKGFQKNTDGSIEIDFGGGNKEKFANAGEVLKQLLIPAAAIATGAAKQLTPYQQVGVRQKAIEMVQKNGDDLTEENIQAAMNLLNPQGKNSGMQYGNNPQVGGEKVRQNIKPTVRGSAMWRDRESGKMIKKGVTSDGKVIDYEQDPKTGKWVPKMPFYPDEGSPVTEAAMQTTPDLQSAHASFQDTWSSPDSEYYRSSKRGAINSPDDAKTKLFNDLKANGYSDKEATDYINRAIEAGKL